MKPNEMSNEELALLIEQGPESELSYEEISEAMAEICSRLRTIDALEIKIKGMIEIPMVEALSNGEVLINRRFIGRDNAVNRYLYQDTLQALGVGEDSTTDAQEQK